MWILIQGKFSNIMYQNFIENIIQQLKHCFRAKKFWFEKETSLLFDCCSSRDLHGKKTMKHIYCPEAILNAFIEKLN